MSKDEINKNRIVRVRNEKVHRTLVYVASLTHMDYQFVFEVFLDYIVSGHVFGDYTEMKLVEMVLLKRETDSN